MNEVLKFWNGISKVVVNKRNLGYKKNFQQAIKLCHGDIIYLSDQDDVWDCHKLAIMNRIFKDDKDAILVFHDAEIVNERLNLIRPSFWTELDFNPERFLIGDYSRLLINNVIQGSACAFRKKLFYDSIPFPEEAIHDEWLGLNACFLGKIIPIKQTLLKYRQTGYNALGGEIRKSWIKKGLKWIYKFKTEEEKYIIDLHDKIILWEVLVKKYPKQQLGKTNIKKFYQFIYDRYDKISQRCWHKLPSINDYKDMYNDQLEGRKQYIKDRLMILYDFIKIFA